MIGRHLWAVRGRRALVAVLLVAGLAAGSAAYAASLTVTSSRLTSWHSPTVVVCAAGTVTVPAIADSYVDQDMPGMNFGTDGSLKVRTQLLGALGISLGGEWWTLVRFTLPATPPLCAVTNAKLRLFASAASPGRTLSAYRVAASWGETTVNWTNKPATAGTAVTTTSGTGYREWIVTGLYSLSASGFLVRDDGGSLLSMHQQLFNSHEAASNRPELVVTFE